MTMSPTVSVVTAAYNAVSTIRRCCESVAGQDYAPLEHLVVDGGSTDGTVEVLRKYGVRYESAPDAGVYDGLFMRSEEQPWTQRRLFPSETHVYDFYTRCECRAGGPAF